MGLVSLVGSGSAPGSNSNAAGIPPSNCYNLTVNETENVSFYAWQDLEENIIFTLAEAPEANDKTFAANGILLSEQTNTVTSYDSLTTAIVVNEITYERASTSDTSAIKNELKWHEPADTIIDNQLLCTWAGTKIIRKAATYPDGITDGAEVIDNQTRNGYVKNPLVEYITDTENDYKYKAFPYSKNGVACLDDKNNFGSAWVFEFTIDENSNPANAVKYVGANENYTPAKMDFANQFFDYGSWENAPFLDFFKPVMQKYNGDVDYFLHPNDFTKKEDGVTASDVANTSYGGNAMCQIAQIWIKEENIDGKKHISLSNKKVDNDYDCFTHLDANGNYQEFYYRALYDGANVSNKIRSISGLAPCVNVAGTTQITYAQANGTGWDIEEFNFRRLINYLLILMGKSLDTESVFGNGRNSGGTAQNYNQLSSGTMNDKGMFWGDNDNGGVKVFYIENLWGNVWNLCWGILQTAGKLYYKLCKGMQDGSTVIGYKQDNVIGYIDSGITLSGTSGGAISKMTLVPGVGLVPTVVSGSTSTNYCDGCWWTTNIVGFGRVGSASDHGLLAGAFALSVAAVCSYSYWDCGVALSYRKTS